MRDTQKAQKEQQEQAFWKYEFVDNSSDLRLDLRQSTKYSYVGLTYVVKSSYSVVKYNPVLVALAL